MLVTVFRAFAELDITTATTTATVIPEGRKEGRQLRTHGISDFFNEYI
jgi:hypothetical protein